MEREPFIVFRVLIAYDPKYKFFVAHCLQTGSVVTADDSKTAESMIKELLEDEISYAIVHDNLKNLLASPAPLEVWKDWSRAATIEAPTRVVLNITAKALKLNEPEMSSEVKVARAAAAAA